MEHNKRRIQLIVFAIFVLPITLYLVFKSISKPQFQPVPHSFSILDNGDTLYHKLPPFRFTDQNGKPFTREDMLGNISLMSFISPADTLLTKILISNLRRVHDNIVEGAHIRLVSVHTDSTSLAGFAAELGTDPQKWLFVHGPYQEVYRIGWEAFRLPDFEGKAPPAKPFTAQSVVLIDKAGEVRKVYAGTDLGSVRTITDDLRSLIVMEYPEELRK
ncbi:MAG: hypothetical protein D6730_00465 [Bacteroidetes bacterium]|nr:MAG: hypothetical protein D6730_00465 [Bacteroidota bacterium]